MRSVKVPNYYKTILFELFERESSIVHLTKRFVEGRYDDDDDAKVLANV